MKVLVTVCARAGSKGVRSKNTRAFMGRPLYYYTLAAIELWRSRAPEKIEIVCALNTDSEDMIRGVKLLLGDKCLILPRPEGLAGDVVSKWEVLRYSLRAAEENTATQYDLLLDLDVTSPLRTVSDIQAALDKTWETDADVVFSVTESRRNPYFNMIKCEKGVYSKVIDSDYTARQQAPTVYDMNASIYCVKRGYLLNEEHKSVFQGKIDIIHMRDTAILDIDCENDYQLMQVMAKYLINIDDGIKEIAEKALSYPV